MGANRRTLWDVLACASLAICVAGCGLPPPRLSPQPSTLLTGDDAAVSYRWSEYRTSRADAWRAAEAYCERYGKRARLASEESGGGVHLARFECR